MVLGHSQAPDHAEISDGISDHDNGLRVFGGAGEGYARNARIASPFAVMMGGRENLLSCRMFCWPAGRRIKYSANAVAEMRGSCRVRTAG